jgi:hypothetical protein
MNFKFNKIKVVAFNSTARVGKTFTIEKQEKLDLDALEKKHLEQLEYERIVNLGHHSERGL